MSITTSAIGHLPTREIARRLSRTRFGEGDPGKVQRLLKMASERLENLAGLEDQGEAYEAPEEVPPAITSSVSSTSRAKPSRAR